MDSQNFFKKLEWYHYLFIVVVIYFVYLGYQYYNNPTNESSNNNVTSNVSTSTESFDQMPCATLYYTSQCGWSKKFLPEWQKLENEVNEGCLKNKMTTRKILCESGNESMCFEKGIKGFPTVVINLPNGQNIPMPGYTEGEDLINSCKKLI
jgi:hypothetical protein